MSTTGARLLVVDDDPDMLRLLSMRLSSAGYQVTAVTSAETALTQLEIEHPQLVLSDVRLPGRDGLQLFDEIRKRHPSLPVILLTAHGTIPDAVEATARGVFTYLTKPYDGRELLDKIAQALALGAPATTPSKAGDDSWRSEIVSRSNRMAELLAEARMVAKSDASVLLRGDSGAGKELLARAIHKASARADKPFVAVNCGAIPEALLESELFGHMKGAFTDAHANHKGLFQQADGGTLLLDEIGDMPPALQVKLLRVLQERAVRPLGASQSIQVDVRIVSATHRDLDAAMEAGQFREDLYYRLNVVTLTLPPLSARREDIPLLANHFLQRLSTKYGKRLSGFAPEALKALTTAAWPGNVRQLFNVVEQVCALSSSPLIPLALVQRALRVPSVEVQTYAEAKQRFERDYLVGLLKLTDGNVADAARLADRNRTEFYRLLQKHELTPGHFKADAVAGGSDPVAE
ncbi:MULTISPECIES: sigma 54-interacting transcriptional regulator [Variovorax]|jgi:two-component system, NtrC family, response regulator GlrR|uniref:sigma 54-interacting transcriptional regulator n=1 Tax=Variovorax TaxID=34072 RepID=UPI00086DFF13|nr:MULTISPECIES: sigma 54-interacting transcriptional regulator [Variovorax]MBN8751607.1 sigma 54-interacting transcriptional regulator [Variovorax sp.]ODU15198.1 MAG: two-component system response regulator GlrR [Variovorax sp. SCN 67-85]ODV15977.1 MAG: two-component system response regulator GlrR [Variovorax sp. SCN 67-20]OJZ04549.1 MAG: two-component system response regulator GlrR [Variovorax sp. 67-131]UKI09743.1 sigma 54-interacting transcriptional regulator [Variovorax paradoxus]